MDSRRYTRVPLFESSRLDVSNVRNRHVYPTPSSSETDGSSLAIEQQNEMISRGRDLVDFLV